IADDGPEGWVLPFQEGVHVRLAVEQVDMSVENAEHRGPPPAQPRISTSPTTPCCIEPNERGSVTGRLAAELVKERKGVGFGVHPAGGPCSAGRPVEDVVGVAGVGAARAACHAPRLLRLGAPSRTI